MLGHCWRVHLLYCLAHSSLAVMCLSVSLCFWMGRRHLIHRVASLLKTFCAAYLVVPDRGSCCFRSSLESVSQTCSSDLSVLGSCGLSRSTGSLLVSYNNSLSELWFQSGDSHWNVSLHLWIWVCNFIGKHKWPLVNERVTVLIKWGERFTHAHCVTRLLTHGLLTHGRGYCLH